MSEFQGEAIKGHGSMTVDEVIEEVISKSSIVETVEFDEGNIEEATVAKEQGNAFFRDKDYDAAIDSYSRAIHLCPKSEEFKETLAIFYGNRAACFSSIDATDQAIEDCRHALELNPEYVKVLMRRSQLYEKVEKWDEALADAKKIQEVEPSYPKISKTVQRLEAICKEKFDKLKDEALGKLKDLGNSILGNFGMSLDNFKFVQDPNTGSYSISMNNGGAKP